MPKECYKLQKIVISTSQRLILAASYIKRELTIQMTILKYNTDLQFPYCTANFSPRHTTAYSSYGHRFLPENPSTLKKQPIAPADIMSLEIFSLFGYSFFALLFHSFKSLTIMKHSKH